MTLTRRAFAAGLAAAPLLGRSFAGALLVRLKALGEGPALLNSYIVQPGGAAFDVTQANAAYVYDNALAGLLLLAAGERAAASRIGQALSIAQAHDRTFSDGRLRNAYQAGPMTVPVKLAGFWDVAAARWDEDPYQLGAFTGPIAWAMLLWEALGMHAEAAWAGRFLASTLAAPHGFYGGLYGYDGAQQRLIWQSAEQNTDAAVAFRRLGLADGGAAAFVRALPPGASGLAPEGALNSLLAADAGIWPYLAGLAPAAQARAAITALRRGNGIGFSAASDGVWLEGTAFAALALRRMRDPLADVFLGTVAANRTPEGYVYACVDPVLSTGFTVGPSLQKGVPEQAFNYYRRGSLSATAWAGLAALGVDPLS